MTTEKVLTEAQREVGLNEAIRIINRSAGFYFAGEIEPFADEFKEQAILAIQQTKQMLEACSK